MQLQVLMVLSFQVNMWVIRSGGLSGLSGGLEYSRTDPAWWGCVGYVSWWQRKAWRRSTSTCRSWRNWW